MFEIRITAPELSEALLALAEALKFSGTPFSVPATELSAEPERPADPAAEPAKKNRKKAKVENPTVSSATDTAQLPATAEPASVGTPAADKMPSLDDIATAGAELIDAGKLNELMEVLAKYGAETIFEIQPTQFTAFVTDLRALGAKI